MNRKDLEILNKVSKTVNSILDYPLLLEKVMDLAIQSVAAERGAIVLLGDDDKLELAVAREITRQNVEALANLSTSVLRQVIKSGKPLLSHDIKDDLALKDAKSVLTHNIQSVLCVPLVSKGKRLGAIYVDSRSSKGVFGNDNLEFLTAFSDQAAVALENARLHKLLSDENRYLKKELLHNHLFESIVGKSPEMQKVFDLMRKLLDSPVAVFIGGETGTGKELVARALHYNGARKEGRFIPLNCGSLPESLLESELFGYKKGAFTGASSDKKGLFEEAHNGTLFLDEIADITPAIQSKLLRVLQEQEFFRIGDTIPRRVDVRVISATNKDLTEEIHTKRFRKDLFYRLNVVRIDLPRLAEREGDIPLLAKHFLHKYSKEARKKIEGFTSQAMRALECYSWPGNIRELENVVSRAVVLACGKVITREELDLGTDNKGLEESRKPLKDAVRSFESGYILKVLEECKGNRKLTAARLGISLRSLQYKLLGTPDEDQI